MYRTIQEQLNFIKQIESNKDLLDSYFDSLFEHLDDLYSESFDVSVFNNNADYGEYLTNKGIMISEYKIKEKKHMINASEPFKLLLFRDGIRSSDNVKIKIHCSDTKFEGEEHELNITDSLNESNGQFGPGLEKTFKSLFKLLDYYLYDIKIE